MKLITQLLIFLLSFTFWAEHSYAQEEKLKTYKGENFSVLYPISWEMTNEDGILNFFPKENYGAVTISLHSSIDFPLEETKNFILDMNEIKDDLEKVKMTKKGNTTEFYYEHTDKSIKWITKAIRKSNKLYLLTVNCELSKWDNQKKLFIRTIESFKLN